MNKVLLDTNFILNAIQCKIDFFDDISTMGFKILVPDAVIGELKNISNSKKKMHFRDDARLALKLLEKNEFEELEFGMRYADKGIVKYLKANPRVILATMDQELKKLVENSIMVIRARKKLEIV
ncbi:MAG: hypothetical protein KC516_04145 [Nanoarchaeota archaeon]|nr:hypothetical protein [Nanoarchaeota archaeon]